MALSPAARERGAAAVTIAYVAFGPGTLVLWASTLWSPLLVVTAVGIAVQVDIGLFEVVRALVAQATRRRVPYMEKLRAESWAALVGVPVATTVSSAGLTLGTVLLDTARWRPTAVGLIGLGLIAPALVVIFTVRWALAERHGRGVPLFDDDLPAKDRLAEAERQFGLLRAQHRYLLGRHRDRWLGSPESPAEPAWPTNWRATSGSPYRPLVVWTLAVTAVAAAPLALHGDIRAAGADALLVPASGLIAAITTAAHAFRMATEEQVVADRLRERIRTLRAEVAAARTAPAPVVERSRWRRALDVLVGREG